MFLPDSSNIVVTGLGVISPCGIGPEALFSSLAQGHSAAAIIQEIDLTSLCSHVGCQIRDFDPFEYMDPKRARRMDKSSHLAIAAAQMAFRDAGLDEACIDPSRIGCYEGTSLGGSEWLFRQHVILNERGINRLSPFTLTAAFIGSSSGEIAIDLGLKGPCMTICTGSASGADAIGLAMRALQVKEAEVLIAGGTEAPFVYPIMATFDRVKATSRRNDNPTEACRPFDKDRDGFILGEGAAFIILEREDHARRRGARIRGRLLGYGKTCDAFHMNAPDPQGEEAAEAIRLALKDASIEAVEIDYVNAHGTATALNDPSESNAIRKALGDWGGEVFVSSTKPITGHLLGASGAIEAIITLLTLEKQIIPPNLNLKEQDPECPLHIVSPKAIEGEISVALSNSYGFGGKNTTLAFGRFEG